MTLMMKCPAWFSSRLLMSCPQADDMKGVFGEPNSDLVLPGLEQVYTVLLEKHRDKVNYHFDQEAVQELSRFFDEEWSAVLNQLEQNEHEEIIGKSMGQIVRISGILKALDNALQYCSASSSLEEMDYEWDWTIDVATIKCAIVLGKYFLEQKLAMTFMVETGFFNISGNSVDKDNGSMNGNLDTDYPDSPTTLPQTAFQDSRSSNSPFGGGASGGGSSGGQLDSSSNDGSVRGSGPPGPGHNSHGGVGSGGGSGGGGGGSNFPHGDYPMPQMPPDFQPPLPPIKMPESLQQSLNSASMPPSFLASSSSSSSQPGQSSNHSAGRFNPSTIKTRMKDVDYSNLPHMMTTVEEDMTEMMQAIDFVHFSKTQFVAVHGRRIKRLLECYDDGHGVSATTAAQKSITPPVRIEGTNNRHPAWASALFFQKVADLDLGIAEQGRHPTNRKVCWRFKRKPMAQLIEKDNQLLQYLRIDMEKYAQFGSAPFNPTVMINSGLIKLNPTAGHNTSSPIGVGGDEESSNSQGSPRAAFSVNVKPEVF